jgi:hypothetical protein
MAAIGKLTEEGIKSGVLLATEGLLPSSKGALVRLSGGKLTVTDGPFAEAKELIGGFAIIQVKSKEEAVEQASRFMRLHQEILGPSYTGECEIRQLFDPSDFAPDGKDR